MAYPNVAPYGSWKSPITADVVAAGEVGLEQVRLDGVDVYWVERRSQEGGRKVIVRRSPDRRLTDITPVGFNARTRVHEYGGGDYAVSDGTIIFSNFTDQRLYVQRPGLEPWPLTSASDLRYADGVIDRRRDLFFCVREDHTGHGEAINTLTSIDLKAENTGKMLVSGNDFYSSPRLSPDGSRLAWLTWSHPNMPWDGTELWVADLAADGSASNARQVAGGPQESIFQPAWSPEGLLHFISDRTGWWNLYRWREDDGDAEALAPSEAEFGRPQWGFRMSTYGFVAPGTIVCTFTARGGWALALLN
ncbi:MAG: TolB family protein, partial [Gammaproteobacteria bacterium]